MKVYKYTSIKNLRSILQNTAIKCTPYFQLNDPFELRLSELQLKDWGKKVESSIFNSIEGLAPERFFKDKFSYYGVISFSRVKASLPMFAYYADEHKGAMLEFDLTEGQEASEFFVQDLKNNIRFLNVEYSKERTNDIFESSIKIEHCNVKHDSWEHESEVRFVADFRYACCVCNNGGESIKPNENSSGGSLEVVSKWKKIINSGDVFHPLFKFNPLALTGIYLGCNADENNIKKMLTEKFCHLKGNVFKYKVGNDFSLEPYELTFD